MIKKESCVYSTLPIVLPSLDSDELPVCISPLGN